MRLIAALSIVIILTWIPIIIGSEYIIHLSILICINAILALSLNLMMRLGQLSIAHGALMGIGAYCSALMTVRLGVSFSVGLVSAGVAVTLLNLIFGPLFLRIRGIYFVLLTFAFGEEIILVFQEWVSLFGGNNGLFGIPRPEILGMSIDGNRDYYILSLIITALSYLFVRFIYNSKIGIIIDALEENDTLCQSLGVDSSKYRILVFAASGFLAGLSGSLYAHYLSFISPEAFNFWKTIDALVINVIGGVSSPLGPIIGAILIIPLPELLRDIKEYQVLTYGVLLGAFLIFLPGGVINAGQKIYGTIYGVINKTKAVR